MKLILAEAAEAEQFDDAPVQYVTDYPDRKRYTKKKDEDDEGGGFPTETSMDKLMFQASALPFKPTPEEILEVAQGLSNATVRRQLESITAKTRWLIVPPKGLEDVPKQMLIKQLNKIFVLTEEDATVHKGNTHEFDNAQEAQYWLDNTLEALRKAHYKVL
jgi:hypothetical protein